MTDFSILEQVNCSKITLKTFGNDTEDYLISEINPYKIKYTNESGESYDFIWESSQQFRLIHTFKTGDFLCNNSIYFITIEKLYSWNSNFIKKDLIAADLISPTYISLVAEASGYPTANLYSNETDTHESAKQYLNIKELKTLKNQPVNPAYLSCPTP